MLYLALCVQKPTVILYPLGPVTARNMYVVS